MGPDDAMVLNSDFAETFPPGFDGITHYAFYRQLVLLLIKPTGLASDIQGPALVGLQSRKSKDSAKSISINTICSS